MQEEQFKLPTITRQEVLTLVTFLVEISLNIAGTCYELQQIVNIFINSTYIVSCLLFPSYGRTMKTINVILNQSTIRVLINFLWEQQQIFLKSKAEKQILNIFVQR